MIFPKAWVMLLVVIFTAGAAHGDEAGSPAAEDEQGGEQRVIEAPAGIYETVVVARRAPQRASLSDRSIGRLSEQQLEERSPRTLPEALWDATGAFVQQTNHGGGSPILRGMIGPQNLILVDGVRLNNSLYRTGPVQYLNLIDPLALERVELLRGPGSVLYGSDAMGGVISTHLAGPREVRPGAGLAAGGRALVRYGSADIGRTFNGRIDASDGRFGMLGGVTYKRMDDLRGGGSVGDQPYSGYGNWSAVGRLAYEIAEGPLAGWRVSASYLMTRITDAGRTDKLYDKHSLQLYDNLDDLAYARLAFRLRPIRTRGEATVSYQHFFERKDSVGVGDDLATWQQAVRDEVRAHTLGLDLQATTRLFASRLRLRYGGMWYGDWVGADAFDWSGGGGWQPAAAASYQDGSRYRSFGGYLMTEGDPLRSGYHILRTSVGYRLSGMGGDSPASDQLPATDFDHLGHVFCASVQYLYSDAANVALTFSQGFRAPNLNEAVMIGDTGKFFHVPNRALEPERSDTFELLARGSYKRLTLGASGYVSLLDQLIKRVPTTWQGLSEVGGKPVVHNVNGASGLLWGVEGELALSLPRGFSVAGTLSYTRGTELIPDAPDQPLTRIPPLFGGGRLRYEWPRWRGLRGYVETFVRVAASQGRLSAEDEKDVRIPEGGTPGWWTWNLRGGLWVADRISLQLSLENLLDRRYKYHGSGLYAPGINATATLSAAL